MKKRHHDPQDTAALSTVRFIQNKCEKKQSFKVALSLSSFGQRNILYCHHVPTIYICIFLPPICTVFPELHPGYFGASTKYLFSFSVTITDASLIHSSFVFAIFHTSLTPPACWSGYLSRIPVLPYSGAGQQSCTWTARCPNAVVFCDPLCSHNRLGQLYSITWRREDVHCA